MKLGPNTLELARDENGEVSSDVLETSISKLLVDAVSTSTITPTYPDEVVKALHNILEATSTIQLMLLADVATDDAGIAKIKEEIMRRDLARREVSKVQSEISGPRQRAVQDQVERLDQGRVTHLEERREKGVER